MTVRNFKSFNCRSFRTGFASPPKSSLLSLLFMKSHIAQRSLSASGLGQYTMKLPVFLSNPTIRLLRSSILLVTWRMSFSIGNSIPRTEGTHKQLQENVSGKSDHTHRSPLYSNTLVGNKNPIQADINKRVQVSL